MSKITEVLEHQFQVDGELVLNERHEPARYPEALANQRRFITGHDLIARAHIARNRAKQYIEAAESMERLVADRLGLKEDPGDGGYCASCRKSDGHYADCALDVNRDARRTDGSTMWAVPPLTTPQLGVVKNAVEQRIAILELQGAPSGELPVLRIALDRLHHSSQVR